MRKGFSLPLSSVQALERRARLDEITDDEALRRAIWFYTTGRDQQDAGGTIQVFIDEREETIDPSRVERRK